MPKETITLVLDGKVTLPLLAQAVEGISALIEALQRESNAAARIDWVVDGLESGSAIATFRGIPLTKEYEPTVADVVTRYEETGRIIQSGELTRLPESVRGPIEKIIRVLNGKVTGIRFETDAADAAITSEQVPMLLFVRPRKSVVQQGAVRGRVQSLSNRGHLRFTLYDIVKDRAVSCYLATGSEDIMRDAWGKMASVEGMVSRDADSGQPICVRNVRSVVLLKEGNRGDWRQAMKCAPPAAGDTTMPEDVIRRIRND